MCGKGWGAEGAGGRVRDGERGLVCVLLVQVEAVGARRRAGGRAARWSGGSAACGRYSDEEERRITKPPLKF